MTQTNAVLIVDDVPINVALMSALVERVDGLRPVGFDDPLAALAWCQRELPILVLVDFAMPRLDGAEFVARLRALDGGGIIPVIVVTARTDRPTLLKALAAGANDFIRKPIDEIEVMARVRSLSQLGQASRQIAALASIDELTGFETRRQFLGRLHNEIQRARRYGMPLSIAMFDVDHFKQINDTSGHSAGDFVLREIGRRTRSLIRDVDFVGRLGGEEFAWVLPSTGLSDAARAADRLRHVIEADRFLDSRTVTASFGVATAAASDDASSLLDRADRNLYQAKEAGRNRVVAMLA